MAVSGRRIRGSALSDSLSKASDEVPDTSCQPCLFDRNNVTAIGYCQTCDKYLCKTCLNVHRKQSATRNHTILQNDQMPKGQSKSQESYFVPCKVHAGETVKYYCDVHEVVGCGDCMVLEHKSCKVNLVTDVSADYIGGQKQSELNEYVKKFENKLHLTKKSFKSADDEIDACQEKVIADVKAFRKQINMYLDKVEADIIEKSTTEKKEQEQKIVEMKGVLKAMEDEIAEINLKRNTCAKQNSAVTLFINDHIVKTQIENVENALERLQSNILDRHYEFQGNDAIKNLIQSDSPIGHIAKRDLISCSDKIMEMEATFIQTIEVEGCRIRGSTNSPPGHVVLVDNLSSSVMLLDTKDMKITASLTLSYRPWDVTLVRGSDMAVTIPQKKRICFIVKRSGALKERKTISVDGECYGITNMNNKLIVSYINPCKIDMLNTECRVLQTIVTTNRGAELFNMPRYIAICPLTSNLYVSDYENHSVAILTIDGHHLATFTETHSPQSLLALSDGAFIVASCGEGHVQLVSADFNIKKILVKKEDGLHGPMSICFSRKENTLFVSNDSGSKINVYKLT